MRISNCCYAPPFGETCDDLGFCSECMEHAVFEGEEEDEEWCAIQKYIYDNAGIKKI